MTTNDVQPKRVATASGSDMPDTIRALLLDDSEFDRKNLQRIAKATGLSINVDDTASIASFSRKLTQSKYDMIIVDYSLPEGNGIDAVALVQSSELNSQAPTIMVSGDSDLNVAIQAMKSGCTDYLPKEKLDSNLFKKAVHDALQHSLLKTKGVSEAELEEIAYDVIKGVSDSCFTEMRPLLAKILRHTRGIQRASKVDPRTLANGLCAIESSCMTLCDFLEDISNMKKERARSLHAEKT